METYHVFCCGSNGQGQLGVSHEEDISVPICCFESNCDIANIGKGDNHTLLLLENGDLYASGKSCGYARDERNELRDDVNEFKLVATNCQDVAAGWEFSIVVDRKSNIVVYSTKEMTRFTLDGRVDYIRTSLDGILISCDNGKRVYAYGNNKKGQLLGNTSELVLKEFSELNLDIEGDDELKLESVTNICMGRDYSILLARTSTGENVLYMLGKSDRHGILQDLNNTLGDGIIVGERGTDKCRHFIIKKGLSILDIKSMWSSVHVLYETEEGGVQIVSVGNDIYKQLYRDNSLIRLTKETQFDVGTEHGVILRSDQKEAFAWGWGEHGNCGSSMEGTNQCVYKVDDNSIDTIEKVFAGYASTFIVTKHV